MNIFFPLYILFIFIKYWTREFIFEFFTKIFIVSMKKYFKIRCKIILKKYCEYILKKIKKNRKKNY